MKCIVRLIALAAVFLSSLSCRRASTTEVTSLQGTLDSFFCNRSTDCILNVLGQPTAVGKDTIDNIPVTVMRFEDSTALVDFAQYSGPDQAKEPYITAFIKNGVCCSARTNMVRTGPSKRQREIPIIATAAYTGVLLLAVVLTCIIVLRSRKKTLRHIDTRLSCLESGMRTLTYRCDSLSKSIDSINGKLNDIALLQIKQEKMLSKIAEQSNTMEKTRPEKGTSFYDLPREKQEETLARNLYDLGMTARTYNWLGMAGIDTIGKLCSYPMTDLKRIHNLGNKSIGEIKEILDRFGLATDMDLSDFGYEKKTLKYKHKQE